MAISPAATVIASLFPDLWGIPGLLVFFIVLGLLLVLLIWWKPIMISRVPIWILCHSFYWLRVRGRENVPRTGPALLVSNHVSYQDFLFILGAHFRYIRP